MEQGRARTEPKHGSRRFWAMLAVAGPGLLAMLADTDVGSLVTAAQSGARWGYSLVLLQLLLIPMLFVVQRLTARLGAGTGKGHGALIGEHFGPGWAWVSLLGLAVAGFGALMTEFSGLAGVGDLFGLPRLLSLGLPALLLLAVVWTGTYRVVERCALAVGLFEILFFLVAWRAHPSLSDAARSVAHMPLGKSGFLTLVAANVGAVIMPWMIFYQQSATADKGVRQQDERIAAWDTLLGAILSQLVMSALLIAAAATMGRAGHGASLHTVGDVARLFTPALGAFFGRAVFGAGIVAAAMVSAVVVSLALAWGFGDVAPGRNSLAARPREAPTFYAVYTVALIGSAVAVQFIHNLVTLNIAVEVMNALLLPLVLGLLVRLAERALPPSLRLGGLFRWAVYGVTLLAVAAALVGVLDNLGVIGGG